MSKPTYYLLDSSINSIEESCRGYAMSTVATFAILLFRRPSGYSVEFVLFGLLGAYSLWKWWQLTALRIYAVSSVSVSCDERGFRVVYPEDPKEHKMRWEDVESVSAIGEGGAEMVSRTGFLLRSSSHEVFIPLGAPGYSDFLARLDALGKPISNERKIASTRGMGLEMSSRLFATMLVLSCFILYYFVFAEVYSVYKGELRALVMMGVVLIVAIAAFYWLCNIYLKKTEKKFDIDQDLADMYYADLKLLADVSSGLRREGLEDKALSAPGAAKLCR